MVVTAPGFFSLSPGMRAQSVRASRDGTPFDNIRVAEAQQPPPGSDGVRRQPVAKRPRSDRCRSAQFDPYSRSPGFAPPARSASTELMGRLVRSANVDAEERVICHMAYR